MSELTRFKNEAQQIIAFCVADALKRRGTLHEIFAYIFTPALHNKTYFRNLSQFCKEAKIPQFKLALTTAVTPLGKNTATILYQYEVDAVPEILITFNSALSVEEFLKQANFVGTLQANSSLFTDTYVRMRTPIYKSVIFGNSATNPDDGGGPVDPPPPTNPYAAINVLLGFHASSSVSTYLSDIQSLNSYSTHEIHPGASPLANKAYVVPQSFVISYPFRPFSSYGALTNTVTLVSDSGRFNGFASFVTNNISDVNPNEVTIEADGTGPAQGLYWMVDGGFTARQITNMLSNASVLNAAFYVWSLTGSYPESDQFADLVVYDDKAFSTAIAEFDWGVTEGDQELYHLNNAPTEPKLAAKNFLATYDALPAVQAQFSAIDAWNTFAIDPIAERLRKMKTTATAYFGPLCKCGITVDPCYYAGTSIWTSEANKAWIYQHWNNRLGPIFSYADAIFVEMPTFQVIGTDISASDYKNGYKDFFTYLHQYKHNINKPLYMKVCAKSNSQWPKPASAAAIAPLSATAWQTLLELCLQYDFDGILVYGDLHLEGTYNEFVTSVANLKTARGI